MNPEPIRLDPREARVLGVLIEKAYATPEQYPMSLNGLTAGCNQKSNRDPEVSWTEDQVDEALQGLKKKELAFTFYPANARVEKYRHSAKERLGVEGRELATLAELLLRGPQTLGELRTRVSRMLKVDSLEAMTAILETLLARNYVRRVPPPPGSRAELFEQLLSPNLHPPRAMPASAEESEMRATATAPHASGPSLADRVAALEAEVARLKSRLDS